MIKKIKQITIAATITAGGTYGAYDLGHERKYIGFNKSLEVVDHVDASKLGFMTNSFQKENLTYEEVVIYKPFCAPKPPPMDPGPEPLPPTPPSEPPTGDEVDWSYNYVHAKEANDVTLGEGQIVGIVDTGVDLEHPDLKSRVIAYANYSGEGSISDVRDLVGHGSWIAGHIGAIRANGGMRGLTQAKFVVCKGLAQSGGTQEALTNCLEFVRRAGARFVNNSWGGGGRSSLIEQKLAQLVREGINVHIAAGNEGGPVSNPAAYVPELNKIRPGGAFAVRATDRYGNKATFSNDGWQITNSAPGVNMKSTCPTQGSEMGQTYCYASGTSMATPTSVAVDVLAHSVGKQMAYVGPLKIVDAYESVRSTTMSAQNAEAKARKYFSEKYYLRKIAETVTRIEKGCQNESK